MLPPLVEMLGQSAGMIAGREQGVRLLLAGSA